jgi:D-alanine-D-alanine ligase
MRKRVALVYNEPIESRYDHTHEEKAVLGVLEAVAAVRQSLAELGHEITVLPLLPPFERAGKQLSSLKVDVVFNLFEGFCGEPESEALVPEYLFKKGIPFTGCPAPVLRLALDKVRVKQVLRAAGVPTADFQLLNPETVDAFRLRYPCIVKPRGEDASHGIDAESVVNDRASLEKRVKYISEFYRCDVLVEEFLTGKEFNATVMGNRRLTVLPPSEIVYSLGPGMPAVLTFAAKWDPESDYFKGTRVVCPAEISPRELEQVERTSLAVFRLMGCSGYARVDTRMDSSGCLNVLELNPNPDISPESGAARQATAAGMSYTVFVDKVIKLALEKKDLDLKNPPDVPAGQTGVNEDTGEYARI